MKKWLLISMLFAKEVSAQTISQLTLSQAYDLALKNYPIIKQKGLIQQSQDLTVENLQKGYFPQFAVLGQASYQSDVTSLVFSVPGINIPLPERSIQSRSRREPGGLRWRLDQATEGNRPIECKRATTASRSRVVPTKKPN